MRLPLKVSLLFFAVLSVKQAQAADCYASPPWPLGNCPLNECFVCAYVEGSARCDLGPETGFCSCSTSAGHCVFHGVCSYSSGNCLRGDGTGPCNWNEPPRSRRLAAARTRGVKAASAVS